MSEDELDLFNVIWQHPRTVRLRLTAHETARGTEWDAMLTVNMTNDLKTRSFTQGDPTFYGIEHPSADAALRKVTRLADEYEEKYGIRDVLR